MAAFQPKRGCEWIQDWWEREVFQSGPYKFRRLASWNPAINYAAVAQNAVAAIQHQAPQAAAQHQALADLQQARQGADLQQAPEAMDVN